MWSRFAESQDLDPTNPTLKSVSDFLMSRINEGCGFSSIKNATSAFSKFAPAIDGYKIGSHPVIVSIRTALYKNKPPQPKYSWFWSPVKVAEYLDFPNEGISLSELGRKLYVLISLAKPIRSQEVCELLLPDPASLVGDLDSIQSISLRRGVIPKTQGSGPLRPVVIKSLPQKPNLCVVRTCVLYLEKTAPIRQDSDFLFISPTKPHKHIRPNTGLQWRVKTLRAAGITTHDAHSFRGAVASYLENECGLPMEDIMREGGWRSKSCLRAHYLRE